MTVFLSGLLANQSVLDVEVEVEVGMVCLSAIKTEFKTLIIESSAESNASFSCSRLVII
jgi:hypothetical protein